MNAPNNSQQQQQPKQKQQKKKKSKNGKGKARRSRSKPNSSQPVRRAQDTRVAFKLSGCAEKYFDSLLDPFDGPADACVPVNPSFPSQKLRVFARGTFYTQTGAVSGTIGMGYIAVNPTCSSDGQGIVVTGTNSTATSVTAAAGTTLVTCANSPYATSAFTSGQVQCRFVSSGVRIRYAGTVMQCGGTAYALETPDHGSVAGMTASDIMAFDRGYRVPLKTDGKWITLCWAPVDQDETEYSRAASPNSNTNYHMVIMVLAAGANTTTSIPFDYEVFHNVEIIGKNARGLTENRTDQQGTSLVQQAIRLAGDGQVDNRIVDKGNRLHKHKGLMSIVGNLAKQTLTGFLPKALGTAVPLLGALL